MAIVTVDTTNIVESKLYFEEGLSVVKIKDVVLGKSKAGNIMLTILFVDPSNENREITGWFVLSGKGAYAIKNLCECLDLSLENLDTDLMLERLVTATIEVEESTYRRINKQTGDAEEVTSRRAKLVGGGFEPYNQGEQI